MQKYLPRLAITAGEPAGIGPDLCVMLANVPVDAELIVLADKTVLQQRAAQLGLTVNIVDSSSGSHQGNGTLCVLHHPITKPVIAGELNSANSQYVLDTLVTAIDGCITHRFDAMVTAPVHKGVMNQAGMTFTGHTEFLADHTHTSQVVMMLVGSGLRVALATTHLPLSQVSQAITRESLETTIRILNQDLISKFGFSKPRILVAGLNPHAGESGYLGREEIDVITPTLNKLQSEGMELIGPLPADTLFTPHHLKNADAVLAMYHDQGLPVLKHVSFGGGVNVTLGLPIIRTSVDHGTALDLAGKGNIELGSLLAAINLAIELVHHSSEST